MAKMLPPQIPEDVTSRAERRLFNMIETSLSPEWIALYSVGLASHPGKPWAEIDFVLVGPPGIFCLEVKGGRVAREQGMWTFTDRFDRVTRKRQGPFEQVGSASSALRRYLVSKLPHLVRVPIGHGVCMPDIVFTIEAPDMEPRVTYDERDTAYPFSVYINRLVDFWQQRLNDMYHDVPTSLSPHDRAAVVDELRPDFDIRVSLRTQIGEVRAELLRLTAEQYRVLDGLAENPRAIIRGGVGTGKTLLAVYEAQRRADLGQRVLLCCYNRRLAMFLREVTRNRRPIDVYHLHGLMADLVREAGLAARLPNADREDLFTLFYPETTLEALLVLDRLQEYDALIVDEAQDLLLGSYIDVFDALLSGGIAGGNWRFFLDPNQDIFRATGSDALARISAAAPVQFRLSVNCRNTAPIGVATAILSGADSDNTLTAQGPDVQQYWYRDSAHQRREVSRCIGRLVSSGVQSKDIVVLSRYRRENSCLRDGFVEIPYPLIDTNGDRVQGTEDGIVFSTIASYKGLESDVVVLVDVDDLEHEDALLSVYVGASRPRALLAAFIDEQLREVYGRHAFEYGQRLASHTEATRPNRSG